MRVGRTHTRTVARWLPGEQKRVEVVDLVLEPILHGCRKCKTDQRIKVLMLVQIAAWSLAINDRWVIGELAFASTATTMLIDAWEDMKRKKGIFKKMVESMQLLLLLRWLRGFLEGTLACRSHDGPSNTASSTVFETCSLIVVACW